MNPVQVWSLPQRVLHWSLAAGVAVAWWAGEGRLSLHNAAGYVALAAVSIRLVYGVLAGGHAGFRTFVHGPVAVARYARALLGGREQRYLGHNPLGGWMVLALLACTLVACASGVLYTLDAFWGMAWLEWIHRGAAWAVLGLAGVHVLAVGVMSFRHRENLAGSMLTGRKRPSAQPDHADEG